MVTLHGQLGTHRDLHDLARAALPGHMIVSPDLRGRGASVCRDMTKHTWAQHVADVIALGFERFAIIGASFGAGLAAAVALAYPTRVEALVMLAPPYSGSWGAEQLPLMQDGLRVADVLRSEGVEAAAAAAADPERLRRRLAPHDPTSLAAALFGIGLTQPIESVEELSRIDVPALVVPGADAMHDRRIGEAWASAMSRATLIEERPWPVEAIRRHLDRLW